MNERELRDCFGLFTTGVMVATTAFKGGLYGMTINSFSSTSLEPPLLLFSVDNKSFNLKAFQKSKHFSLSILSQQQLILAQEFAKPANESKWQVEKYFTAKLGSPIFEESMGYFECERYDVVKAGDHHIIIGKIISCAKLKQNRPLLYMGGAFSA
ncbi:MAG: flavin reductase [Rickettsiales bacterium]|nr:flavin reductase [Rickettsiales bacterium]